MIDVFGWFIYYGIYTILRCYYYYGLWTMLIMLVDECCYVFSYILFT